MDFIEQVKWCKTLKEGDKVALKFTHWGGASYKLARVTRITPTGIIKVGEYQFDPQGRRRGQHNANLEPWTDEVENYIKRVHYLGKAKGIEFHKLSLDQLMAIVEIANQK